MKQWNPRTRSREAFFNATEPALAGVSIGLTHKFAAIYAFKSS